MRHHHYRLTKRRFFKNKYKKKYVGCLIGVNCGLAEELLFEVDTAERIIDLSNALRAVMELHEPINSIRGIVCRHCFTDALHRTEFYPCPTIQTIEKELQ